MFAKDTGEMRLIGKAGLYRDGCQRLRLMAEQLLGSLKPGIHLPIMRARAGRGLERMAEMRL